ncbi:MAG TPA: DEAD/DEAH box helicase family protein, partial [Nannocystis sp.]
MGSSNLSRAALTTGVEWNLRAIHGGHAAEVATIRTRFEKLWDAPETAALTPEWIEQYAARIPARPDWDPPAPPPTPHPIQRDALAALAQTREDGAPRGLVVLATGLGKTLLAAFDALQMGARRVLFVAHRDEILTQARRAFAALFPGRSAGFFKNTSRDRETELLFATVQTLARPQHLSSFAKDHFDLIVIDEFHHAAALSYRRILGYFTPRFFLGLTATPERGDGTDLLHLCADNVVFRADLAFGIRCGRLVPFVYHGLKDTVDYAAIPWRSGRFDPVALSQALATTTHAQQALRGYTEHAPAGPRRGLWFCASIAHAEFMAAFLRDHGIRAVAVHSEKGGAPRAPSLRDLMIGQLEAITTVDVFNEGIDVPDINVVVLLRPTESRVVFLQQIGRGLRLPDRSTKPHLVILDFIGNHRTFLARPAALMSLFGTQLDDRAAIRRLHEGNPELPAGCSVHLDTEVIDLLARLAEVPGDNRLLSAFLQLRDTLGRRPTLTELVSEGYQVGLVKRAFVSWWQFLADRNELSTDEARVFAAWRDELVALEKVRGPASAPWPVLRAWVERGGVTRPIDAAALATASDGDDPARALVAMLPRMLVDRGGAIAMLRAVDAIDAPVLEAMIDEVAEAWALAARRSRPIVAVAGGVAVKVIHNGSQSPILVFNRTAATPRGEIEVWVEGEPYVFRFVKTFVNVAATRHGGRNVLPALLRWLFGPDAGKNGMDHRAVIREQDGRYTLIPSLAEHAGPTLPYYSDLAVACGLGDTQHSDADRTTPIRIRGEHQVDPRRHFVVRARSDSMNGGELPIRDG